MEDPTQETQLLQRIVELLDRDRLGLIDDPPGRRTIYAHRNSDSLWHFWDQNEEARIPIEKEAVRGILTDCFCYVKRSAEGESTKVRVALQCASAEYEIETSLSATSGRGLMSGLLEAGEDIERPITIGVRPADKEQVLFMDVYTDESGLQINGNHIGAGDEEAALNAVRTVRERLGLNPDPWDNRLADNGFASNPSGAPKASATQQRQKHESEKMYDQSNRQGPSPEQAANALLAKVEDEPDDQLAGDTAVNGTDLAGKLVGLAEYVRRGGGYMSRVLDALGVETLDNLSVGNARDAADMILDEDTLRQNESFQPDDELPF